MCKIARSWGHREIRSFMVTSVMGSGE